jgi:hypothetical protein
MNVWIRDDVGRVLGPIGISVLRDLISAGRLSAVQAASRDGVTFVPVAQVPEVADLVAKEGRKQDDRVEAERISTVLHVLKAKAAHEVFELPENATLEQFKTAFFRLAKHYHPDRLPADATPELRLAYDSLFHFLAQSMATVERRLVALAAAASPAAPSSARPVTGPRPAANYDANAFVGLRQRPDGESEMEVRVTAQTASMFTENDLVNLAKDGIFIPVTQGVPLGSMLELRFVFDEKTISARGRVVFENFGGRRGKPGIGLKFVRLAEADRAFIAEFVKRVQSEQPARR